MAKLRAQLASLNTAMASRTQLPVVMNGPLRDMDQLTKRIQQGKISSKEFNDTLFKRNKLMEYQNRLQKANLANARQIGTSGRFAGQLNIPQLNAQSAAMKRTAADWATMSAAAKSYGRSVQDAGKNMAFMGRQSLLSITAPIVAIGAATAMAFYDVDKGLTNIVKVYGDSRDKIQASANDIRDASMSLAKDLVNGLGTSVNDTLKLAGAFAALGESGTNLDNMTTQAARLMRLGDVTTESATKMISTLRTVFSLSGSGLSEAINYANEMENSTTLTMQDFSDALPKIGPIVKAWNGDIKDAGTILEAFTRSGINAVEGANALKSGFAKLSRTTPQLRNMFDEMTGGKDLDAIVKQYQGDVPKILAEIGKIQDAQNWDRYKRGKFASQLWGAQQLARGMALTENLANPGAQRAQDIAAKSREELAAIAQREIDAIMNSASAKFDVALQNMKLFAAQIGEKVLPLITSMIQGFMKVGEFIHKAYQNFREFTGPIGDLLAFVGKLTAGLLVMMGPIMLMIAAAKMIKGTLIRGWGAVVGDRMTKRAGGNASTFSTAEQKASQLSSTKITQAHQAQNRSYASLQSAVNRLTSTYNAQATAAQRAATSNLAASNTNAAAAQRLNAITAQGAQQRAQAAQAAVLATKQTTSATRAQTRAISGQTLAVSSNNAATRSSFTLRQQAMRTDANTGMNTSPPKNTLLSSNGGRWEQNTRSGDIARLNSDGSRSPVSAASQARIRQEFANQRLAQLNSVTQAAGLNARAANAQSSAVGSSALNANTSATASRVAAATSTSAAALAPVNPLIRQATISQRAFTAASNQTAQSLARGVAGSYSSIVARQQNVVGLQNRINAAVSKGNAATRLQALTAAQSAQMQNNTLLAQNAGRNAMNSMFVSQGRQLTPQQQRKNAMQARMQNLMATQGNRAGAPSSLIGTQAPANTAAMARNMTVTADRAGDVGQKLGGALVVTGLLGSMFAKNNQALQNTLATVSTIGMSLMLLAAAAPGLLAKIGTAFTTQFGKMTKSVGGGTGKMTGMFKSMGAGLIKALPWAAVAAAGVAAAYVIYRAFTANSRKLTEENDKITKSIEGWQKLLDLAPTAFGQIEGKNGDVIDTATSLIDAAKKDDKLGAVIDKLARNSADTQELKNILEREAVKMGARGADSATIEKGLNTVMAAANLPPQVIDELKIQFKNVTVTGINGASLSDGVKSQLDDVLGSRDGNTASGVQQTFNGASPTDLSQLAKARINDLMEQLDNEAATQDPKVRADVFNAWTKGLEAQLDKSLAGLSEDARKKIDSLGGVVKLDWGDLVDMEGDGLITDAQRDDLMYQKKVLEDMISRITAAGNADDKGTAAMLTDISSAMIVRAQQTGTVIMSMMSAQDKFQMKVFSMGDAWKNLSDDEKGTIINHYRMAAGLKALTDQQRDAAIAAGNLGPEIYDVGKEADIAAAKVAEMDAEFGEGRTADWKITLTVDGMDFGSVEDQVQDMKDARKKIGDQIAEDMQVDAENQHAASERSRKAAQQEETDALSEAQKSESKALSKAQDAEKKAFDKGWDQRIENENKGYEDRIKAIEDTQEAEDDLERTRKRNSDRESRRLKYLQSLMQGQIDYAAAMAGGNLDEAARISLNASETTQNYAQETTDAEAGYKKEDDDRARSKVIDQIKEEQDARMKSLELQREAESEAMQERLEMQTEELQKKQEAQSKYLSQKQANEDVANELAYQSTQRKLQRELDALRQIIPVTNAEQMAQVNAMEAVYQKYGINLTVSAEGWATTIEKGLVDHVDIARQKTANEAAWNDFGNKIANAAANGGFDMSIDDFMKFISTGELPANYKAAQSAKDNNMFGARHGGGPIGNIGGGYDKFNSRGGRSMSSGIARDEAPILAQKGEFMMQKKAVNTYGSDVMHAINNGTFNPGNTGGAEVTNMNAIGGFGIGNIGAFIAAGMMRAVISRAVEATGNAMMNAVSGGGDIGAINISQKAGRYGNTVLNETQLKTAALIAEASREVGASKRDLTIALMTAFQESSMGTAGMYTEVDHDSLGPFQQRAAWGPRADRTDIKKSTKMFYHGGQQGQRGLFDFPNRNSMSLGQAAQAVQVSGNPGAYDQWRDEAEAIIAAGVGTDISRKDLGNNLKFGGWTTKGIDAYAAKWASSAVGSGGPMNVQPGEYQNPVPGSPVTSGYGMRWGALHDGIDFGAPIGTPIYATKAGTVTFASNYDDGGFGYHTVVDHGGGITSGYAHQSRLGVSAGQQVAKGQNIGWVGNTGQSTGPHLHFQLGRGSSGGKYSYSTDPAQFGIPGLRVGGIVGYDNTIANLHKDEAVLTAPLSKSLQNGINNLEAGNTGEISLNLTVEGSVYGVDHLNAILEGFKKEIKQELIEEQRMKQRRVTGK
ncbi:tail length tape measure protein [Rhodococcus phage Trina]|uniref:Tape measure protein n=1 Tax=Rhodococcus phage Trina TaxID=2027905 RepID=A0A2D0ZM66_9CAUD|nr:tail length tape measure protein [Rhodococcus phage Trina]ASZ74895.1 tape measure protein [Rhodococcus phage Trina]